MCRGYLKCASILIVHQLNTMQIDFGSFQSRSTGIEIKTILYHRDHGQVHRIKERS